MKATIKMTARPLPSARVWEAARRHWQILTPALFILIFFAAPIGQLMVTSFYAYDPLRIVSDRLTIENYTAILSNSLLWSVISRTIVLSLLTTLIAAMVAFPVAFRLQQAGKAERLILVMALLSPIVISPVVLAYPWLVLLAPNSGIIPETIRLFGLTPPQLMYSNAGVLIGLVYGESVFMVLCVHAALENIPPSLVRASKVLGATPWQSFTRVILPLSLPGLASGSLLVFSISTSSFMMPYLLGGRQVPVLATYAYDMASVLMNWPSAAAVAGILLTLTGISVGLFGRWIGKLERKLDNV